MVQKLLYEKWVRRTV